jgi:hypothetical protein
MPCDIPCGCISDSCHHAVGSRQIPSVTIDKNREGANKRLREVSPMRKYAAPTALAIALSITMLTPVVSADCFGVARQIHLLSQNRESRVCDNWGPDWRVFAIRCHCGFECRRQYQYTERVHCTPGRLGCDEGVCDLRVVALEATRACWHQCVKAKDPSIPFPRP